MIKALKLVGFSVLVCACTALRAQNKTLAIGTVTPSNNASLHVESPTNNQGFIMPRLTTAQRNSIAPLSATDKGLMLYDTDLKAIYIWDGVSWKAATLGNASTSVITTDLENASSFTVNNGSNTKAAVYATTNGTGPFSTSAAIMGETSTAFSAITGIATGPNGSNAVSGLSSSSNPFSFGVYGGISGAGVAGEFQINNAVNASNALEAKTNGVGAAFRGENAGLHGNAGYFKTTSVSNDSATVYVEGNVSSGLKVRTNGFFGISAKQYSAVGYAIVGESYSNTFGIGVLGFMRGSNGFAGSFETTNTSNPNFALKGYTAGLGNAAYFSIDNVGNSSSAVLAETNGTGSVANLTITNAANSNAALNATTNGTGSASYFNISNVSSGAAAVYVSTSGTGASIQAQTSTGFSAVYGLRDGSTNGHAGLFQTTNAANNYPPLQVVAAGNSSNAVYINHKGTGGNLVVFTNNDVAAARIDKTGKGFFNGGTQNSGADIAEMFDVEGARNEYEPGDVLVISENTDRTVEKSFSPSSTKIVGVYATKPGVILTEQDIEQSLDNMVPMGVVGVIPTKVCLENGPIKRGDLLVTSSMKGHAMKAIPVMINGIEIYPTGAILGKALENFETKEKGLIKVLVNVK